MAEACKLLQSIRGAASTGVRATNVPYDANAAIKDLLTVTDLLERRLERLKGIVGDVCTVFGVEGDNGQS